MNEAVISVYKRMYEVVTKRIAKSNNFRYRIYRSEGSTDINVITVTSPYRHFALFFDRSIGKPNWYKPYVLMIYSYHERSDAIYFNRCNAPVKRLDFNLSDPDCVDKIEKFAAEYIKWAKEETWKK